jgi:hypothetical protein
MRGWRMVALLVVLGSVLMAWPTRTGATFTSRSASAASTASAAYDWTPPTVTLQAPAAVSSGTVTVAATATDTRSSIAFVRLQVAPVGASTWTTLCSGTTSPYSCSWDTTTLVDGSYQLHAVASDSAGNLATSDSASTLVANAPVVTMTDPGSPLRGTVPLSASLANPGGLAVTSFRIESSVADAGSWAAITGCSSATSTISCSWTPATGDYDLRAVAVVGGTTYTQVVQDTSIDNAAPSVSLNSVPNTLSGVVTLSATASDAETGVGTVELQYAPTGTSSWVSVCVTGTSPFACRFDTTKVTDGSYDVRAIASDNAGNTTTSAVQKKVTVNNSLASVSVESPGAYVSGSIVLSANANSSNGIASVALQYAVHGGGSWTAICTDPSSPYSCAWVTTALSDGSYDLRAVMTDTKGIVTTSATISTTLDNSPLRARDLQTVNGGVAGRIDAGDQVAFGYTNVVAPASLLTGWDGSARSVTVRLQDGALISGGTSTDDSLSVDNVNLGSVDLHGNFVKKRKTVTVPATMTAGTAVVGGVTTTTITLVLGTPSMGMPTAASAGTLVWTPSVAARTPAGTACSATPVSESGAVDRDF